MIAKLDSSSPHLALRVDTTNPDHHIWNNNGTYWCHYTIHLPDFTKRRMRTPLKTKDLCEARQRRDQILGGYRQDQFMFSGRMAGSC